MGGTFELTIDTDKNSIFNNQDWQIIGFMAPNMTNHFLWDGKNHISPTNYHTWIVPNGKYEARLRMDDFPDFTINSNVSSTNFYIYVNINNRFMQLPGWID